MKLDSSAFIADQELVEALKKRSTPVHCEEDCVLFTQGEPSGGLYIVHAGRVMMTMRSSTGELLMSITAAPNSLLGLPGIVGNKAYTLSALAFKGAELSYLEREEFAGLMLTEPPISVMILRVLAAEVRSAREAISKY